MIPLTDMYQKSIVIGNILVYPTRCGSSIFMKMGVVSDIRTDTKLRCDPKTKKDIVEEYQYAMVDKLIETTTYYWEDYGEVPPEGAELAGWASHKKGKVWFVESSFWKKWRIYTMTGKAVVDFETALKFKGDDKPERYVERATEILLPIIKEGMRNFRGEIRHVSTE